MSIRVKLVILAAVVAFVIIVPSYLSGYGQFDDYLADSYSECVGGARNNLNESLFVAQLTSYERDTYCGCMRDSTSYARYIEGPFYFAIYGRSDFWGFGARANAFEQCSAQVEAS